MITAIVALLAGAPLDDDAAIALVERAMTGIDRRAANGCVEYLVDDTTDTRIEIAVMEVHNRRCGGAEGVMPTRDRFRVGRTEPWLERYDVVNDRWLRCTLRPKKLPACPRT